MVKGKHNGNGHDPRHVTETPDVSHIKNLDVTHEASDISVAGVLTFVLGLSAMMAFVFVLTWGVFRLLNAQETEKEPEPGPMAMKPEDRLPPEPRLQAAKGFGLKLQNGEWVNLENKEPAAEYRVLRGQWDRVLNCESGGTQAANANCVPIKTAIDKVIQGGTLKVRQSTEGSRTGMVSGPTAWSSGRVTGNEQ